MSKLPLLALVVVALLRQATALDTPVPSPEQVNTHDAKSVDTLEEFDLLSNVSATVASQLLPSAGEDVAPPARQRTQR